MPSVNADDNDLVTPVRVTNGASASGIVLVCEHASAHIPKRYENLGLSASARCSHIAWDPGALALSERLVARLGASLVAGCVSRLIHDCNRPPDAPSAIPETSEVYTIPGNRGLTPEARARRIAMVYDPFHATLAKALSGASAMITIHSFTPFFHGAPRLVEIGVLHDKDTRLADALLTIAPRHTNLNVHRNAPYGPEDGVTHLLQKHGIAFAIPHVMLEFRNDLIASADQQDRMADMTANWLSSALADVT